MARRNLEKAVLASKMIESGLEPVFRFSRIQIYKKLEPIEDPELEDVGIHSVQFSLDGHYLAYGDESSSVTIVNCTKTKETLTIKAPQHKHGFPVTCLRFMPPRYGKLLGSTPAGDIFIMQTDRSGWEVVMREPNEILSFDLNTVGMHLVTGGHDGVVRVYSIGEATSDPPVNLFSINSIDAFHPSAVDADITGGTGTRIHAVRFHPNHVNCVLTAGWDDTVRIFDTRLRDYPVIVFQGPHICSSDGLDFEDNVLLTGSWRMERSLQLWDLRIPGTPKRVTKPLETIPLVGPRWTGYDPDAPRETEYLYGAQFGENGVVIACGSGFHGVRVVRRISHEPVGETHSPRGATAQALDSVFGGRTIAAGYSDGIVELIHMS